MVSRSSRRGGPVWRNIVRAIPEAKRLREAAIAWSRANDEAERNGGTHPLGEGHFAMKYDQELLDAALAFAHGCWREMRPHEDIAYGLRLLMNIAVPSYPSVELPQARGAARAKQITSLGAACDWIQSLPKLRLSSRELKP